MPDQSPANLGALFDAIEQAALHTQGETTAEQRRAAAHGGIAAGQLATYLDKVHLHAFRVSDEEVDALRNNGFSQDAIFELTVAAAVGAGLQRYRKAVAALEASP